MGLSRLLRYKYYQPLADWRFILQNPKGSTLTGLVKEHQAMNEVSQPNFASFLFFFITKGFLSNQLRFLYFLLLLKKPTCGICILLTQNTNFTEITGFVFTCGKKDLNQKEVGCRKLKQRKKQP